MMASSQWFQGGPCIEVFSAAGSKPLEDLRLTTPKAITRTYDRTLKASCVVLDGDIAPSCRMTLPASSKAGLGLKHPIVAVQFYAAPTSPLYFEFLCSDGRTRRRVVLSTSAHKASVDPLHVKLPLGRGVLRGRWLNLCFDVQSIFSFAFPSLDLCAIDQVTIGPTCRVRKVVSLKDPVTADAALPTPLGFPPGVDHATQVVAMPGARGGRTRKGCSPPPPPPPLEFSIVEPGGDDGCSDSTASTTALLRVPGARSAAAATAAAASAAGAAPPGAHASGYNPGAYTRCAGVREKRDRPLAHSAAAASDFKVHSIERSSASSGHCDGAGGGGDASESASYLSGHTASTQSAGGDASHLSHTHDSPASRDGTPLLPSPQQPQPQPQMRRRGHESGWLRDDGVRRAEKLRVLRQEQEDRVAAECTFKPKTNTSRPGTAGSVPAGTRRALRAEAAAAAAAEAEAPAPLLRPQQERPPAATTAEAATSPVFFSDADVSAASVPGPAENAWGTPPLPDRAAAVAAAATEEPPAAAAVAAVDTEVAVAVPPPQAAAPGDWEEEEEEESDNDEYSMRLLREIRQVERELVDDTRELRAEEYAEDDEAHAAAAAAAAAACSSSSRLNDARSHSAATTAKTWPTPRTLLAAESSDGVATAVSEADGSRSLSPIPHALDGPCEHGAFAMPAACLPGGLVARLPSTVASAQPSIRSLDEDEEAMAMAAAADEGPASPPTDQASQRAQRFQTRSPHLPLPSKDSPQRSKRERVQPEVLSSVEKRLNALNARVEEAAMPATLKEEVQRSLLAGDELPAPAGQPTTTAGPPAVVAAPPPPHLLQSNGCLDVVVPMPLPLRAEAGYYGDLMSTREYERAEQAAQREVNVHLPPRGLSYSTSTCSQDSHSQAASSDRDSPPDRAADPTVSYPITLGRLSQFQHQPRQRGGSAASRAAADESAAAAAAAARMRLQPSYAAAGPSSRRSSPSTVGRSPASVGRVRGFQFNNSTLNEFSAELPTPAHVGVRGGSVGRGVSDDEFCRHGGHSTLLPSAVREPHAAAHPAPAQPAAEKDEMDDLCVFESCAIDDNASELSDWSLPDEEKRARARAELEEGGRYLLGKQLSGSVASNRYVAAQAARPPQPDAVAAAAGVLALVPAPQPAAAVAVAVGRALPRTLLYHPTLHCYYDPATDEYFEADE